MRIAFDLDDTLIASSRAFPEEPRGFWRRRLTREPLRKGAVALMSRLIDEGHEVWIYTTSFRRPLAITWLFRTYGIRIRGVVNAERHSRVVGRGGGSQSTSSKYPPAFGIDLLIDDLEGVAVEAARHGFRAFIVAPTDEDWVEHILDAVTSEARRPMPAP